MDNRHAIGKAVLLVLCWVLSFAAMSVSLTGVQYFSFFMRVFMPVMLIFGYLFLFRIPRVFFHWHLWFTALVFAAVGTLGISYSAAGTAALLTTQKLKALVYFTGRIPAYYMGMVLVLDVMKKGKPLHLQYPAALYAAFVFICWLPYLFTVWPGSVSAEANAQLSAIAGNAALTGAGPVLQTGMLGLAGIIGKGVFKSQDASIAIYILVQSLLMAWLFGRVVAMIVKSKVPKWLSIASLLFFAVCPVFPLYAFAISSVTGFALAALWLMLIIWRMMRSAAPSRWDTVSLAIAAVLCALLRSGGIWIVLAAMVLLLIWSLQKHSMLWHGALYALACAASAVFVVQAALLPTIDIMQGIVPDTDKVSVEADVSFNYGYLMPGYITAEEPAFILGQADGIVDAGYTISPRADAMQEVFGRLLSYAPFRILAAPGLYGWAALFALAVLLARRQWRMLECLFVPLAVLVWCMFSPLNGSIGYALPVCMSAPLFLSAVAAGTSKAEPIAL